jgi:hypothetical protein
MPSATKTAPKSPTTTAELQEQVLEGIRQSQQAIIEAARAWGDATAKVSPSLPNVPTRPQVEGVPSPAELVESSFDFAEKLLASQREFTKQLIAALPNPPKRD